MALTMKINEALKTPYYLIDESRLAANLGILAKIKERTGVKILLAQKAFSSFYFYPQLAAVLDGTASSGLYEARLAHEHFGKEVHVFAPAYKDEDFSELLQYADHFVFNSKAQLMRYKDMALAHGKTIGVRINPEISTQDAAHAMYDPCSPSSRFGIKLADLDTDIIKHITGIHFHTLCQQNADALALTLQEVEMKFGKYLHHLKWINFGGGHHLTRADYDIELLVKTINEFKAKYDLTVYLEPGEAVVLNAGFVVATVLDVVNADLPVLILDASATCHMPDVIEMPYTPKVIGTSVEGGHLVRLASHTCLTGDNFGIYRFQTIPSVNDKIIFEDMALYTIVKNNTFNGMQLPAIYARKLDGSDVLVTSFDYEDFKRRLS